MAAVEPTRDSASILAGDFAFPEIVLVSKAGLEANAKRFGIKAGPVTPEMPVNDPLGDHIERTAFVFG